MSEESLTDLSNRYGSDKGTVGPSPQWGAHNFTDIYEAYLERYRFSEVAILEVGLGVVGDSWDALIVHGQNAGGASLKMWHEFFPSGRIFGIDVNLCSYLDNERTKTFKGERGQCIFGRESAGIGRYQHAQPSTSLSQMSKSRSFIPAKCTDPRRVWIPA